MAVKRYTQFYIKCVFADGDERRTRGVDHLSTAITCFGEYLMNHCGKLNPTTDSIGIYEAAFFEGDSGNVDTFETPVFVIKRNYLEAFEPVFFIEENETLTIFEKEL